MSEIITRNPRVDEIPKLRHIWSSVFGDTGMDSFFQLLYDQKLCYVAEYEDSLAAMGYLIPSGEVVLNSDNSCNVKPVKCAMIYSVATLPEHRGLGLGTSVVRRLMICARDLDFAAVVLCPSDDDLFEYYSERTRLLDRFYIDEQIVEHKHIGSAKILPSVLSAADYCSMREKLLKNIVHLKYDKQTLEYQVLLCNELGGGLYKTGDSCAVVERESDSCVWIKELLTPAGTKGGISSDIHACDVIASIAELYPADKYIVRSPSRVGCGRRFGMLALDESLIKGFQESNISPWYGVAFD